jgi:hypothetical protein
MFREMPEASSSQGGGRHWQRPVPGRQTIADGRWLRPAPLATVLGRQWEPIFGHAQEIGDERFLLLRGEVLLIVALLHDRWSDMVTMSQRSCWHGLWEWPNPVRIAVAELILDAAMAFDALSNMKKKVQRH